MRILYHAINGSGHGHLTRAGAIAERVGHLDAEVHQLVVTSNPHTGLLDPLRPATVVLPRSDAEPFDGIDRRMQTLSRGAVQTLLRHTIETYAPDLIVFDTHFPQDLVAGLHESGQRLALVLRRCRDAYLHSLIEPGLLGRFELVLVPHDRSDLVEAISPTILAALERHPGTVFTGPVCRRLPLDRDGEVRARHGIEVGAPLVIVTCGAAGYGPLARRFLERGADAALTLRGVDPAIHVLVIGSGPPDGRGRRGVSYVAHEPELPALFPRAALVVAHGGYNTVHEILAAGAPAIFVPQERLNESQADTVAPLVRTGRATSVCADASLAELVAAMSAALERPRPAPRRFDGSTLAAKALLAALPRRLRLAVGADASASELWRRVALADAPARLPAHAGRQGDAVLVRWSELGDPTLLTALSAHGAHCYVDLDSGNPDALAARAGQAAEALRRGGVPLKCATLVVTDVSGGSRLVSLAAAIGDADWAAIVARVPELEARSAAPYEALNACRRRSPRVAVDVTDLRRPRIAVQRP